MKDWNKIEELVETSREFVLTEKERKMISIAEQKAFEDNVPTIKKHLDEVEHKLKNLGFWVENNLTNDGMRFRFSLEDYYGPGGISSTFHISGPLVLGVINPAGDELSSFYNNDIDECIQIGLDFNENEFSDYLLLQIENYLMPNNLITSKDQYERFRSILKN